MARILASVALLGMLFCANVAKADNAGCGLGSMIFKGNSGLLRQFFAVTTNHTVFFNQALGMTFGTLGCGKWSSIVENDTKKKTFEFLASNFDQFALDAARGEGETLQAVAEIMNVDYKTVSEVSKNNFETLFPNADADIGTVTVTLFELLES